MLMSEAGVGGAARPEKPTRHGRKETGRPPECLGPPVEPTARGIDGRVTPAEKQGIDSFGAAVDWSFLLEMSNLSPPKLSPPPLPCDAPSAPKPAGFFLARALRGSGSGAGSRTWAPRRGTGKAPWSPRPTRSRTLFVSSQSTPTMKLTLVVPLPPILRVWKFLAPSTW